MAKVLFKRYETDAEAQASNIVDGQFIVTKEGTSYTDYGTDRVPFGGTLDTQMSDSSMNGVQNKVIKEYVDDGVQETKNYVDTHINILTNGTIVKAGYQVNGKDIYVKRVTINSLPNNSEKNYDTGLSNSTITPVKIEGLYDGTFPINFVYPSAIQYSIGTYIRKITTGYTTWTIDITTGSNRSSIGGYVDVYFYYNN